MELIYKIASGYYVKDDIGKVLFMNKDVVFKHFMFKSN